MINHVRAARQYEQDILAGTIPACRWVRLAVERNVRDMTRQGMKGFAYRFNENLAQQVCEDLSRFPHIKGRDHARKIGVWPDGSDKWNPLTLEPWQSWIISTVFGWVHATTGLRRFRTALTLVPRKNGKSFLSAAVALYMLAADGESGAEVYSAATSRDQARIVADVAIKMARREPQYRAAFGVQVYEKTLVVPDTASKLEALSSDAHNLDGLDPHLAIVDELHAHKTRDVWDVLETAMGARSQPLLWAISTAGSRTDGICYEQLTYLHKVLERRLSDDTFFGVNYTIDKEDEPTWWKQEVLRKANPNFGVSVRPDDLVARAKKAKSTPSATAAFKIKRLNVWTNAESPWLSSDDWDACADPTLRIEDCRGLPCLISADLAQVRDIASVIISFDRPDGKIAMFGRHYLPRATVDASPIAQMSGWVQDGHLIATEGNVMDFGRIEDDIVDFATTYMAREVLFDPALATHMMQRLQTRLPGKGGQERIIEVKQDVTVMDPAMKDTERLVLKREVIHNGDPVLGWMISNVVIQRDHKERIYPRKLGGKDSHNKIDGVVAWLLQAYRRMTLTEPSGSVYDRREVLVL